ncbi:MAG: PQQ-dependent sugar dehydrogenase [Akkermansiaceae bacterium]|nr:PQQ-dependent sugar dehydrogenase [Akkermansiaceae bacterium]
MDRATLRATADFAGLKVSLNGTPLLALDPYDPPAEIEVTRLLKSGENTLSVVAQGVVGPSAIALSLEIARANEAPIHLLTDASWKTVTGEAVGQFGRVEPRRWALNRLPEISPFAEYNQWKEALNGDPATGTATKPGDAQLSPLPPGFEIEKIRDAQEGEDSWVSLAIDPKGRLIIAKEQKGLLRLTLSDNGREVIAAETIEDTLQECRGIEWMGGALYAHANRGKALYRLRDTTGDDRFDEITLLQATEGGTGHGRNDLAVGPDGALHAITGDDVQVPDGAPRRARPESGAPKELGHWIRWTEKPDGSGTWEAMTRGLRNPYGIDFNADGEPFTYDADNEGDVGLPFYRPTRINHLVSGANYGWHQDRGNTRSFPIYAPDSVPTTYDVGRGSPTGVKFGTRSGFPTPWKEALFALDWAYGRIVAVHITANGASYLGSGEVFLEGRPLNVTDLDFDADGALWFVTGGRKTQSALYRIRYTGKHPDTPAEPGGQAKARADFSRQARELRKSLERFHGHADPAAVEAAFPHLGSPDPWIRNAARIALEWQPVDSWREKALSANGDLAGLTALLALARAGTDTDRSAASDRASRFPIGPDSCRTEKLALMRLHELAGPPVMPDQRRRVADQLLGLAPDLTEPVNRELVRGLIAMDAPDAIAFGLDRLASADDQLERLHYLEALSEAPSGWSADQRRLFFNTLAHAKRFSYGDRFMLPFFQTLEKTALSQVADEEARSQFADLLAENPESDSAPATPSRPFVKHWTMDDFPSGESLPSSDKPDPAHGRELFSAVLCARCHVCGATGRPVGPDLTTVANRFSPRDLIESIVEPSRVVAEVHRNVIVTKTDGSVIQGRIVQNDFRESKLSLSTNPFAPAELVVIPKSEIQGWEESPISPMPPALLDTLTKEEIGDLLAFLLSGGK